MTIFTADKYDPNNDPALPKVGDSIKGLEGKVIKKVEPIQATDLMKLFTSETQPEDVEHLIVMDNPIRPFLKYLVWWEEKPITKTE